MDKDVRPWGRYEVLQKTADYQVKRIEVSPGLRFSLQKHFKRSETWVITSGVGVATVGKRDIPVRRGTVVDVPVEEVHRMHNTGREPLVFIEVQMGNYFGEDDIVRLEDDFKRS